MSFFTDLLRSVQQNQVFGQPAPTPTMGGNYQQPVPTDIFGQPPIERPPVDDFFPDTPFDMQVPKQPTFQVRPNEVLDDFVEHSRYPPNWERPSAWRMLGTGLLSGMRRTPDKVTESYNSDGRWTRNVVKGGMNPLSYDEVDYFLNMPNRRRLDEWKLKGGALKEASAAEDRRMQQESLAQARLSTADTRQGNLEIARQREMRLASTDAGRAELARLKYQLDVWKSQNPNGTVRAIPGGNVVVINPQTGQVTDTGVPSGLMSQEEMRRLMGEQAMELQGLRGTQAIDQINTRGLIGDSQIQQRFENALSLEEARHQNDLELKKTPSPGQSTDRPLLPTQEKQRIINKVAYLVAMNPKWKQWIKIDPNTGQPLIQPPGQNWFGMNTGPTEAEHQRIMAAVFGPGNTSGQVQNVPPGNGNIPQGQVTIPPSMKKEGRIWEKDSSGRIRYSDDNGQSWAFYTGGQ